MLYYMGVVHITIVHQIRYLVDEVWESTSLADEANAHALRMAPLVYLFKAYLALLGHPMQFGLSSQK